MISSIASCELIYVPSTTDNPAGYAVSIGPAGRDLLANTIIWMCACVKGIAKIRGGGERLYVPRVLPQFEHVDNNEKWMVFLKPGHDS